MTEAFSNVADRQKMGWMPTGRKGGAPRTRRMTDAAVRRCWTEEDKRNRERCQRDLFFLAKEVLGYDLMTEGTHRQVTDFFVQKDPEKPLKDQSSIKRRLLLFPRGGFKSSINIADVVQWIICFPDIRVLILTAAKTLADSFVEEVTGFFEWDRLSDPTYFQKLFPEFTIDPKKKHPAGEYTAPNRRKRWKEPTVMSGSVDETMSGWHFEVLKCDDVVSDRNSKTTENMERVTKALHTKRKMLRLGFYYDLVGTRYSEFDAYGDTLRTSGPELSVLYRPALWLKADPHKRVTPEDLRQREESEFDLLFPEELPYLQLMKDFRDDEQVFFCQYMNDPIAAGNVILTLDDMRKATVPAEEVPAVGDIHITWDLAYSTKPGRDYSAAIVARHAEGKMYVIDSVRGRFTPKELAYRIVSTSQRYGIGCAGVERSPGAQFIEPEILRVAGAVGTNFHVDWIDPENSNHAKAKRFEALQPLVLDGRLLFSSNCENLDKIYHEFCNFASIKNQDMADACSRQLRYFQFSIRSDDLDTKVWEELRRQELADLLYGQGKYAVNENIESRPNAYYLPPILGDLNG